nr:ATP-binding cassette domain-containing protein [Ktedonobacterales bacterium]
MNEATAVAAPVVVAHASKTFGRVRALQDISLSITTGETFGLIGPNGSGKTTLLRLLLGLGKPTDGTVHVLGHPMPDHSVARHIGYMTQASALYSELSVRENLAFFASLYGLRGQTLQTRIAETLALVDLT